MLQDLAAELGVVCSQIDGHLAVGNLAVFERSVSEALATLQPGQSLQFSAANSATPGQPLSALERLVVQRIAIQRRLSPLEQDTGGEMEIVVKNAAAAPK